MIEYIENIARESFSKQITQIVYQSMELYVPNFSTEQSYYDVAVLHLHYLIQDKRCTLLDHVLAAEKQRLDINLAFLFWLGIFQNLGCYVDPANKLFVDQDFEEIHHEYHMNGFSEALTLDSLQQELTPSLCKKEADQMYIITSYYSYLETYAYKIAHFLGFCLGSSILGRVFPDYQSDNALTQAYTCRLRSYFQES